MPFGEVLRSRVLEPLGMRDTGFFGGDASRLATAYSATPNGLVPFDRPDGGLGTTWLVDPRYDLTVIVLTQRLWDSPGLPQVHQDIQAAAYAALA